MLKTIKRQMMLFYIIILLMAFILSGISIYSVLRNHLFQSQLNHQTQTAEALCKELVNWRRDYEQKSFDIMSDEEIQNLLSTRDSYQNNMKDNQLRKRLAYYAKKSQSIQDIFIVDSLYKVIGTSSQEYFKTYALDRISTANINSGRAVWDNGYAIGSLILYRKINDINLDINKTLGYLFVIIDDKDISDLFNDYRLDPAQRFLLKNPNTSFEVTERGFFYNYYEGYNDLLHSDVTLGDWNLLTWTDKSIALAPTKELFMTLGLVLIIILFFALTLGWFLSERISKPISSMKEAIKKFSRGDFSARVPVVRNDEVGSLAQTLNNMASHIDELFNTLSMEEKKIRKLQLQTLEYQINPHFLYNTLDSINILARSHNDHRVADIVTSLSRLFRLGLHQGQEVVPIRDEIAHVSYYLKIQSIRFEDQLTWSTDVDEDLLDMKIIKFLLQPCAENAINHGIRRGSGIGNVHITAKKDRNDIVFQVIDNGVGMKETELKLLRESLSESSEGKKDYFGLGLSNVSQRIQLHYGPNYGLKIDSEPNLGTTVTIRIASEVNGEGCSNKDI